MINDAYPYYFIKYEYSAPTDNVLCRKLLYRFKSTKSRLVYIVEVEEYPHRVFAIKFYPKAFRLSKKRFNLLTNTFEPRRIIHTCINIMLELYNKYTDASFGFAAARCTNEKQKENVKRFRVYALLMATYFSDNYFEHTENKKQNAYLMINRQMLSINPHFKTELMEFFEERFVFDE